MVIGKMVKNKIMDKSNLKTILYIEDNGKMI